MVKIQLHAVGSEYFLPAFEIGPLGIENDPVEVEDYGGDQPPDHFSAKAGTGLVVMVRFVVAVVSGKQVPAPVVAKVPPDRVDVVGLVLDVVVFDHETG